MKIVIKIDENVFTRLFDNGTEDYAIVNDDLFAIAKAIRNGTPLPKGHGDLIDRNELLDESYQIDSMYCEYDEVVNVDDIKDAPTIIEGSDKE